MTCCKKNFLRFIFSILLTISLSSCVTYPTKHTYYAPTSSEGNKTMSDTRYMANDALRRNFGKVIMTVSVRSDQNNQIVRFDFNYTSENVQFDAAKIEIRDSSKGNLLKQTSINKDFSTSPRNENRFSYILGYGNQAVDIIHVEFRPGALKINGQDVTVAPIEFKKRTATVLYYNSINN